MVFFKFLKKCNSMSLIPLLSGMGIFSQSSDYRFKNLNALGVKIRIVCVCIYITSIIGVHGQRLKFEHYNDGNGLSHNSVRHIVQDKNGFLWLGTFSGLNRFDSYQFKSYTNSSPEKSINNNDITALELDESSNKLWIGTRNGLTVLKLDTHEFKTFLPDKNNPNGLQNGEIRSVYIDKFDRVWVGTRNDGVFWFCLRECPVRENPS